MNTLNFLDSNVWLALLWSRHVHSERPRIWFEGASEEQFFFCRFMQIPVLRLLSTHQVMRKDTKNMAEAWRLWDRKWADTRFSFLPEPDRN
jgi:predicted nucleic acid-binding protein